MLECFLYIRKMVINNNSKFDATQTFRLIKLFFNDILDI